jgi:hypothetical protein
MKEDDPLLEWNRINNENLEQDFVSEMFINISNTSPLIDKFSIWLFAGTGATGTLLISQIQGVVQGLSITGFKACMFMLIASAISAFVAKYWALRCQIQTDITQNINISETKSCSKFSLFILFHSSKGSSSFMFYLLAYNG